MVTYYFEKYGLALGKEKESKFNLFADYLLSENLKYNLTAVRDFDGVIVRHFVDSAVILNYVDFPAGACILDIGSGAGFPAVPLAIMREDLNFTCLDSSAKKINFIKNAVSLLGLNNLDYICGRAEDFSRRAVGDTHLAPSVPTITSVNTLKEGGFDFAVSRAVSRLNILCELAAPVLKLGGIFCAYKSKAADAELRECGLAFKLLGLELVNNIKLELEGEERAFILVKKVRETPGNTRVISRRLVRARCDFSTAFYYSS